MTWDGVRLTEPQRRALTGCLRHIEREIALVEHVLASTDEGVMLSVVEDLSDATRERLCRGIEQARALIGEAHAAFALEPERIAKSRWIAAHLGAASVVAEECESRHLAGYGEITAEAARRLDPLARRLSELLVEMQGRVLAGHTGGRRHAS